MSTLNAVLVRLSIGMLSNARQDPAITTDVKTLHKLAGKAGRWIKYKLPEEALTPIRKVASAARAAHYFHSLPWDEGTALLPVGARAKYESAITEYRDAFNAEADGFIEAYPAWIEAAKLMHNGTFNECDYPAPDKARLEFTFGWEVWPMPSSSHFDATLRGLYGEALEETTAKRVADAVNDTWQRLLEPVRHMALKLADPDAIFRDSLVDNVREVCQLVPALNLTGDQRIAQAVQAIQQQLASLNPDNLRESKVYRRQAFQKAQEIAQQFGKFGQRKIAA